MSSRKKPKPRWLVLNRGCEVSVYAGPFLTQRGFVDALVRMMNDKDVELDDQGTHTAHILEWDNRVGGPNITDFSVAFMDAARRRASSDVHDLDDQDDETLGLDGEP